MQDAFLLLAGGADFCLKKAAVLGDDERGMHHSPRELSPLHARSI